MENFKELKLHKDLISSLDKIKFSKPTPIQAKAIPFILKQRDVLGSAHTGTGKTAAFCIPLIDAILNGKCKRAIILAPTRELAQQIENVAKSLLQKKSPIKCLSLVGGEPINKQLSRLKNNPQIIIGTPGRVNDHLRKKSLNLSKLNFLVLDEMDRMLDMGFSVQIDEILKFVPKEKQTLMFSATVSKTIERLSSKYLKDPERITVEGDKNDVPKIDQKVINLSNDEKFPFLTNHIETQHGLMLVFVKTKRGAKNLAKALYKEGFDADAIHGDLRQNKRAAVIKKFRSGKIQILVATDVAARGLDIPNIDHVINYDLPQQSEDFIHRIGRTGRAGAKGQAWSLVTSKDKNKWREIEQILYPGKKTSFKDDRKGSSRRDGYKGNQNRKFGNKSKNKRFNDEGGSGSRGKSFRDKKGKSFKGKKFNDDRSSGDRRRGKSFGDRKGKSFGDKKGKSFGDRKGKSFGDKKFNDDSSSRGRGKSFGDRKGKSFGDRKGKSFGDKKFSGRSSSGDQERSFKGKGSKSKFSRKRKETNKTFDKKNNFKGSRKKR